MTKKIQCFLIGYVLLMLYRGSSGYEAGDECDIVDYAPHFSDCTKFYHCEHNIFVEKICPSDLHFNPDILICDYAVAANCQLATVQSTTETTPETTTLEIPTEQTTDETTLAETTEWLTITTEEEILQTSTTQFFTETTLPSSSEITTETLTEITEHHTTEIDTTTSESFTDTTEYKTSEFITASTDLTTADILSTDIATTIPQTTTTAEPFDEFGACLEYTAGPNNGYTDFMSISDISRQRADYVELKVFVRTAKNAHIMLTADRNESGFEIQNSNNELYIIKQTTLNIKKTVTRGNLLNVNEYTPFIIRIFEKRIEFQLVGERKPLLEVTVNNAINVRLISFGTAGNTIGKWLYGCQLNPAPPTWPLNEPANSCKRMPSGVFLRLADYHSSPNHETIVLKVYVATSAETVTIHLSSADYSSSISPYYDILIGKINQIWRCSGPIPIANKIGSINLVHATQLAPILITITLAGRIQVTVNDESKTILQVTDPYAIDVQYVKFIATGDIPSVWYHGDC